jgi:hypothetical protein
MRRKILSGWKEISSYIQRGVRTAQRWEALLGMPVHRPALKDRSAVVAFSDELDGWLSRTDDDKRVGGAESTDTLARVQENVSRLARQSAELASRTKALQEELKRSAEIYRTRIASRMRARSAAVPSHNMAEMLPFRLTRSSRGQLLIP